MLHHIPHSSLTRHYHGWLDSRFHFAFAGDMAPMGFKFGPLRVWNDDWIAPNSGFDMHPHRDMEIITYVRKGAITHRDSVGNQGRTAAGNVQVMSAGTGIFHSEHNEEDVPTELFQIWVEPDKAGLPPRWEEAAFPTSERSGRLVPLASGQKEVSGALKIHQDATFYGAFLKSGDVITHDLAKGRRAYIVPAEGRVKVNGQALNTRDGLAVLDERRLTIEAVDDCEIVLFDLP